MLTALDTGRLFSFGYFFRSSP